VTPGELKPSVYVAALLREREGYLAKGNHDRAQEVEAELRRAGYTERLDGAKAKAAGTKAPPPPLPKA
jgi:hypothetical protein